MNLAQAASESNPVGGGILTCLIFVLAVGLAFAIVGLRK